VVAAVEGNFKEIERKAFERYLLDLARLCAAEEERAILEKRGWPLTILILQIDLIGEYPYTAFEIRCRNRDGEETKPHFMLYQSSEWFDEDGKLLVSAGRIVGDTLMWARGG
jgi:hypothetical protein